MARGSRRLDEYLRRLGQVAPSSGVDLDEVVRRIAEEAVREALERLGANGLEGSRGGLGEVVAKLERLEERLGRIEEELKRLREEVRGQSRRTGLSRRDVEELARAIAAVIATRGEEGQGPREPRWLRLLAERLRERGGIIVWEELPPELRRELDPVALESRGYVVASLGGQRIIATREALRVFGEKLRSLKASDEYEAEAALGRFGKLFRLLRSEGLVYYAGPSRGWILENRARQLLGI